MNIRIFLALFIVVASCYCAGMCQVECVNHDITSYFAIPQLPGVYADIECAQNDVQESGGKRQQHDSVEYFSTVASSDIAELHYFVFCQSVHWEHNSFFDHSPQQLRI